MQRSLEVKNKSTQIVIQITSNTHQIANDLLTSMKNNILAFLLTVVLMNGLKNGGIEEIFSNGYLAMLLILDAISVVWFLMLRAESKNRFSESTRLTKKSYY